MEEMIKIKAKDFEQLVRDVALLKNLLLSEGELSDWAKEQLKESRNVPLSSCISQEDIKKELLN